MKAMRQSTLETLGLGNVLEIFQRGSLPVDTNTLIDEIFGPANSRGSLVISGANGIVGAGKMMQLGSRLAPYGITMVGLDFPGAPDGIGRKYPSLIAAFGQAKADTVMSDIIRFNYDGKSLPPQLAGLRPKFLLEAIPEILSIKKAHYDVFRRTFPEIEIRSVTSGFPASELGVGIAHPAFPHEINKVWETVEQKPSAITELFWSLGMVPTPVSDHWSFVLDVLFCGLTLSALRYHGASNMPVWKIDKFIRRDLGPNPFRAHDVIGAKGANFLTWSCLHHLSQKYGPLFTPSKELEYHKESGHDWYPLNHFRPLVNWSLAAEEEDEFSDWILGSLIQMTSLMLHEKRSHLSQINAIGELCAQFRRGILAVIRNIGPDAAIKRVEAYHKLYPQAATGCWYPETLSSLEDSDWQQLYVNAEHDGKVGVISISRESYNSDVDTELNRAIDWLKAEKIERVIVTGDFHLSTQMVGADTADFYPALKDIDRGYEISSSWSKTARRFHDEFKTSVGVIVGKRCLGGMLELMMHCHYLIAVDDTTLGMPEVTLPVIPGMEGCHWYLRKAAAEDRPKVLRMLLTGENVKAKDAVGWLIDFAGPIDECIKMAWKLATDKDHGLVLKAVCQDAIDFTIDGNLPAAANPAVEAARKAVAACIKESCAVPISEALAVQARHSGAFMAGNLCKSGIIGADAMKVLTV
jgi:enoyl-CoA hydratase/carnithine racemase/3-hydroxyacyl-CoA dehydrogenase